jgi:C1A family cysteine protease
MSYVDSKGFMQEPPRAMATPIGGHAWRVVWYDAKKDAFLMRNSWGREFGFPDKTGQPSGYAWMRRAFLDWLLPRDTEMAGPTQVKLKPVRQ